MKSKNVEIEEFDIWKEPAKAKEMLNGARTIPQRTNGGNEQLQELILDKILNLEGF